MKTTAEIRRGFLDFFHTKKHQIVSSSSLIPHDDPTLLFTNAGMNQFKDVFLGTDERDYVRAATSQRCVRAGGKHNDLDNVGYTARHHTFFEMLGNFSFGDYFKREAINYAWEFLTSDKYLNLDKNKLYVTIYATDDEAFEIWNKDIGIAAERIIRIGDNKGSAFASDNFWQMGDTGPCGPCTEIFYDHGDHIWGGLPGSPEEDGDRYIEIWNVVFMQYNRQADGTMLPLPKPSVDTGMGLERITAVIQHVNSNYDIDIFKKLIAEAAKIIGTDDINSQSLKVIADHIRSCSYLIADGVIPSNEGRGYVLRRIIRRAVRHGNLLGATEAFFYKLVPALINTMEEAGDLLKEKQQHIEDLLRSEEEQFKRTLDRGLALLYKELEDISSGSILPGEVAFKLYDTYGFPLDLTADVCRELNITVDEEAFAVAMDEQKKRAQEASNFSVDYGNLVNIGDLVTEFAGYTKGEDIATVEVLIHADDKVEQLVEGQSGVLILNKTPFYAESGGQIGDTGIISTPEFEFKVEDTQKYGNAIGHIGTVVKGKVGVGTEVHAAVNIIRRNAISLNHSATHLLHAALRQELGKQVEQRGSLVADYVLRFDFSYPEALTEDQLRLIEDIVNHHIRLNHEVRVEEMSMDEAKGRGAMALFDGRYKHDKVRVLTMSDFSMELCGGVHTQKTGNIGLFKITAEYGVSLGIRRIEALTGELALKLVQQQSDILNKSSQLLKADPISLTEKIQQLQDKSKKVEKELQQLKEKLAMQAGSDLVKQALDINGVKVIIHQLDGVEIKNLRIMTDDLKNQLGTGIVILGSILDDKPNLVVGVTKDLTNTVKAGELVNILAEKIGGKGGGRPDLATAGGSDTKGLSVALADAKQWLTSNLIG